MKPYAKDIEIRFGDRKEIFVRVRTRTWDGTQYVPGPYKDLTGYTFLSQIRATTDATEILASFTATMGNQAEPTNGLGSLVLKLTGTETAAIPRTTASGVWDLQLTDTVGNVDTYIAGAVSFTKDVSRG